MYPKQEKGNVMATFSRSRSGHLSLRYLLTLLSTSILFLFPFYGVIAENENPSTTTSKKSYRLALVPKYTASPFFEISRNGCLDAAMMLGVNCSYVGPDVQDAEMQAQIVTDLIENDQVDGLAISVIDTESIQPVIEKAVNRNIPVVTFDSDAPDSGRLVYVGTNNTFFGEQLGKVLKQLAPEGGTYAVIGSDDSNILERETGFKHSLSGEDGEGWIEISTTYVESDNRDEGAMDQIWDASKMKPTAIVPLFGAPMRALSWKKFVSENPQITLVVADGMQNQLELLAENYASGLVGQKPYEMGYDAIATLVDLLNGKSLSQDFIGTNLLEHTNIPLVLPELVVNQNLIGELRYVGFILFGLVLVTATGFAVWVWLHRSVRVVAVAQPKFLMMIAVGLVIMSSALIPLGFEDNSGHNPVAICMSPPWLGVVGFTTTFSALFAKTWRVYTIFRSRGLDVKPSELEVLRPFILLLTGNVVVLILWTVLDPLTYVRDAHEGTDGWNRIVSTYGSCRSENLVPFVVPLALMNVGVLAVGNWHAYETRMVRSEFSESKFIGLSMATMIQAFLTGIPLMFLVREQPRAFYLLWAFMIFTIRQVDNCRCMAWNFESGRLCFNVAQPAALSSSCLFSYQKSLLR